MILLNHTHYVSFGQAVPRTSRANRSTRAINRSHRRRHARTSARATPSIASRANIASAFALAHGPSRVARRARVSSRKSFARDFACATA